MWYESCIASKELGKPRMLRKQVSEPRFGIADKASLEAVQPVFNGDVVEPNPIR